MKIIQAKTLDTNVPVTISVVGKSIGSIHVNQRSSRTNVISLGVFDLPKGTNTSVTVSNEGTTGYVVADGMQFVPVGKSPKK